MMRLPFLLVLSALADGTLLARFFTAFCKALVAAGFPATVEGIAGIVATSLVALWAKRHSDRKQDRKLNELRELIAAHGVPVPPKPARKRKKINV